VSWVSDAAFPPTVHRLILIRPAEERNIPPVADGSCRNKDMHFDDKVKGGLMDHGVEFD
jgi:hypothetical protein